MNQSSRWLSRLLYEQAFSPPFVLDDLTRQVLRDIPDADFIEIRAVRLDHEENVPPPRTGKLRRFLRDRFGPQCVNPHCRERGNHDSHRA